MSITTALLTLLVTGGLPGTGATSAPRSRDAPHVVEVRMVDGGGGRWHFEPATVHAEPGDTVRFIQTDIVPHNVQFKDTPPGASLGTATMGPFLLKKGDTYSLTIDDRFAPGTYQFVCTPHEMMGMKGTLNVGTAEGEGNVQENPHAGAHP